LIKVFKTISTRVLVKLTRSQIEEVFAHAQRSLPSECCGLLGGMENLAKSVYQLTNIAVNPLTEYQAAPADLFKAQRLMRLRGEKLLAIYHSHPLQSDPLPSETDVRQAFYRDVIYFIIGRNGGNYVLRGFRLYESERRWEDAGFIVTD
jgi:proteasome lid subunit RPN8/RPN11